MEKTTIAAKRTSSFLRIENPNKRSGYKMAVVDFTINEKNAQMMVEETYKSTYKPKPTDRSARMVNWQFVTGDKVIDGSAKIQTDFSAFDLFDIAVDINDIIFDAENFFDGLKEKEKAEAKEKENIARGIAYDNDYYIVKLKPALEAKGHTVTVDCTKDEFIANSFRKVGLLVDGNIIVDHDYHDWFQVRNDKSGDNRITKTTKSSKMEKQIEAIEWVIGVDKANTANKIKEQKEKNNFKEQLEGIIGTEVVEEKEWHPGYSGTRRHQNQGYYTSYFKAKDEKFPMKDLRFSEVSSYDSASQKHFPKIEVRGIPSFNTDGIKLKKLLALLAE